MSFPLGNSCYTCAASLLISHTCLSLLFKPVWPTHHCSATGIFTCLLSARYVMVMPCHFFPCVSPSSTSRPSASRIRAVENILCTLLVCSSRVISPRTGISVCSFGCFVFVTLVTRGHGSPEGKRSLFSL